MAEPRQRHTNGEAARRGRAWVWPAIIVGMLVIQAAIVGTVVFLSTADPSFSVEPDYYQKALKWDDTAAQLRKNTELGWGAELAVGQPTGPLDERQVSLTLSLRDGKPLEGASVALVCFSHSRGSDRIETILEQVSEPAVPGCYAGALRLRRTGVWEFRFTVTRGPDTFTLKEIRDVRPGGEDRPWVR